MSHIIMEWIPITEREPGYYEDCLVTVRLTYFDGSVRYETDYALHFGDGETHYIGQFDTYNDWLEDCTGEVIAWMPIPDPYKEEVKQCN